MKSLLSTYVMLVLLVAVLSSCQKEILPVGDTLPLIEERMGGGDDLSADDSDDEDTSNDGDTPIDDHNGEGEGDDEGDGINDGDGDDEDDEGGEQRGAN